MCLAVELVPVINDSSNTMFNAIGILVGFFTGVALMLLVGAFCGVDDDEDEDEDDIEQGNAEIEREGSKNFDRVESFKKRKISNSFKGLARKQPSGLGKSLIRSNTAQGLQRQGTWGSSSSRRFLRRQKSLVVQLKKQEKKAEFPFALAAAVCVDAFMDGFLIGISTVSGRTAGVIVVQFLCFRMVASSITLLYSSRQ
jgi:zinc transporter ZupT